MVTVREQIDIRTTPQVVWNRVIAFETMPEWFYGPRKVTVHSLNMGIGAERTVRVLTGHCYRERFVRWEPDHAFAFEVLNPPFATAEWLVTVTVNSTPNGARVEWEMRYATQMGRVGVLVGRGLLAPLLRVALRLSLRRLKRILENRKVTSKLLCW